MAGNPFIWWAPHHAYIGAFIMLMGLSMTPHAIYDGIAFWVILAGGVILVDDVIEHTLYKDTPLRLFYEIVLAPWLRKM